MSGGIQVSGIDAAIGISVYATRFPGLGAGYAIKKSNDDFEVCEVLSPAAVKSLSQDGNNDDSGGSGAQGAGHVLQQADSLDHAGGRGGKSGMYGVYVLQKRGIDTAHALDAIYKITGARLKPLGLKDASAVTMQYVCSTGTARRLRDVVAPRFNLRFAGYAKKPLTKRQMLGNRFRIRISGSWDDGGDRTQKGVDPLAAADMTDFDEHDMVPNFYGYQRFGSRRPVTHLVGRAAVMRDFDEAVRLILEFDSEHDVAERRELRQNLADPASYEQSAARLPAGMDTEKIVLCELARHGDPMRAFRAVPLQLRRLYVSAYQSYVFNRVLSAAVAEGENISDAVRGDVCFDRAGNLSKFDSANAGARTAGNARAARGGTKDDGGAGKNDACGSGMLGMRAASVAVPIIGYSYYSKTRFDPYVSHVLEDEPARPRDFFIKEMQEISGEGGFRDALLRCTGYSWDAASHTVEFSLGRGSFATMLLREMIKPPDPVAAGF